MLHLGCGLDARVYRIDPPATVGWYDLDYPGIIELRQRFLPPREHPRLGYVDETPMNDSPVLMAKAPVNVRRVYRLPNLLPGMTRSTRIVRFRF
ncbi:class I SAM-dependent methyltransferase [Amycolatopsis sp. NPDC048633]|uniref:class I SAM-dependent methyltransferase n=1 Tax=Amycolatopsis sp. NPDC048633 TaxID=3157095 RepID=UPI0033CDA7D6